jgi:uncharacterized membrane protein
MIQYSRVELQYISGFFVWIDLSANEVSSITKSIYIPSKIDLGIFILLYIIPYDSIY